MQNYQKGQLFSELLFLDFLFIHSKVINSSRVKKNKQTKKHAVCCEPAIKGILGRVTYLCVFLFSILTDHLVCDVFWMKTRSSAVLLTFGQFLLHVSFHSEPEDPRRPYMHHQLFLPVSQNKEFLVSHLDNREYISLLQYKIFKSLVFI